MRFFLIILCFVITINKSQVQSLLIVVVYLSKPVFTRGQLYITVSRVKDKRGLKIICLNSDEKQCKHTTNIMYKEVFQNL
ncbi:hypothetical protein ACS0TY_007495 [Phlomoides rotata]